MNELTGTIHSVAYTSTGNPLVTFEMEQGMEAQKMVSKYKETRVTVQVKEYREKRSLSANALCWELCTKLAKRMSNKAEQYTKEDIYRQSIKEIGVYKDFENLPPADAKTLRHAWELLGTGWITEQVDFMPDGENVIVRCYYGSSQYNKKQMSRLINNLVQDCIALGVEHRPPEEVESILKAWGE